MGEAEPGVFAAALAYVPARARFVGRFLGYTSFSSLSIGLVCGSVGASCSCGPLIPFISGAWLGYSGACLRFWRHEVARTLDYISNYPRLMEHALEIEFSRWTDFRGGDSLPVEKWIADGSWAQRTGRLTWAVLAAQSCQSSIDRITEARRHRILQAYSDQTDAQRASLRRTRTRTARSRSPPPKVSYIPSVPRSESRGSFGSSFGSASGND